MDTRYLSEKNELDGINRDKLLSFKPWDGEIVMGKGRDEPEQKEDWRDSRNNMYIIELTTENVLSYVGFVPVDVADHIDRTFFYGLLAVENEAPLAGMVWEVKNMLVDEARESRIVWMRIDDPTAADELFATYEENIEMDDVEVSSFVIHARRISPEKDALKAHGFSVKLAEGDEITATLEQAAKIPLMEKIQDDPSIKPLWSANPTAFSSALKRMTDMGHQGVCEDLFYLPRLYFDNDVSCFYEKNGQIDGLMLFHRAPSGNLKVILMVAVAKDFRKILLKMIKKALVNAMDLYASDTKVVIDRHNYATLALGEKLFPNEIGMPVYVGSRKEM